METRFNKGIIPGVGTVLTLHLRRRLYYKIIYLLTAISIIKSQRKMLRFNRQRSPIVDV